MRTALIDADVLAYKAAAVSTDTIAFGDEPEDLVTTSDINRAKKYVIERLNFYQEQTEADAVILCLSSDMNWRRSLYPAYKAQRSPPLPVLAEVKEYLHEKYDTKVKDGLEADDVMGILATHPKLIRGEKVIVSEDKDMATIPGLLFNPNDVSAGVCSVSEAQADWWHMMQTLTGDTVDNYPGCPGIGPVKAKAALTDAVNLWAAVIEMYAKAGLSEADALLQARLARICRYTDYDFKHKRVKLWNP